MCAPPAAALPAQPSLRLPPPPRRHRSRAEREGAERDGRGAGARPSPSGHPVAAGSHLPPGQDQSDIGNWFGPSGSITLGVPGSSGAAAQPGERSAGAAGNPPPASQSGGNEFTGRGAASCHGGGSPLSIPRCGDFLRAAAPGGWGWGVGVGAGGEGVVMVVIGGVGRNGGISPSRGCPVQLPPAPLQQGLYPRHAQATCEAGRKKGETNLIIISVRRWRSRNPGPTPSRCQAPVHSPCIFQLGLENMLPADALASKGEVPARRSPVAFRAPARHRPAPGGPPVTHILLLQGGRLQEQCWAQPAGRC